jgi:hypothetical protein
MFSSRSNEDDCNEQWSREQAMQGETMCCCPQNDQTENVQPMERRLTVPKGNKASNMY